MLRVIHISLSLTPPGIQLVSHFYWFCSKSSHTGPYFHLHCTVAFNHLTFGHCSSFHTGLLCLNSCLSSWLQSSQCFSPMWLLVPSEYTHHPRSEPCPTFLSCSPTVFVTALLTLLWFPQALCFLLPPHCCTSCPVPTIASLLPCLTPVCLSGQRADIPSYTKSFSCQALTIWGWQTWA